MIILLYILAVVPEEVIPATVAVVLVEDNVLIVLEKIFPVGAELAIPVTAPPVPVEDNPVIVLLEAV